MGWKFNSNAELPTYTGNKTITGTLTVGGQILAAIGTAGAPGFSFAADPDTGIYSTADTLFVATGGTARARFDSGNSGRITTYQLAFDLASSDVLLQRDAANVLALRNSTNAQRFNIYNTYTDSGNNENGYAKWVGNEFRVGVEKNGSGTARDIIFDTNATQRWGIGATNGNLYCYTDNTQDIGASGANRPRSIYVGTNVTVGGQVLAAAGTVGAPGISFSADPTNGMYRVGTNNWGFAAGGTAVMGFDSVAVKLSSAAPLVWSSAADISSSGDLVLRRDAANTLALRNGTNAQAFNIYNTTDAGLTNYEAIKIWWNSNVATIQTTNGGSGVARAMEIIAGSNIDIKPGGANTWQFQGTGLFARANMNLWNGTSALATTATAGFLGVNSCAGPPTGVPASIPTGQTPLVWDSTNLKLYCYTGGAWKSSAAFT